MSQSFTKPCPECGTALTIWVEDSCGPPSETGTECPNCGAMPVWHVTWGYWYEIDDYIGDERTMRPYYMQVQP